MDVRIDGQRALVTAGAGGIGLATATALQAAGATVVVCDVDASALRALPTTLTGHVCDVSDPAAVDRLMASVLADGALDILVNNAGIAGPTARIEDIAVEDWRRTMAIDLDGMFHCLRRVVPGMRARRRGCIVNLSSTAGIMGLPLRAPYVAAKFAVVGLTKTLAMELGPDGIRVNAIAPGSVEGDRMDRVIRAHAAADGIPEVEVRRLYTLGTSMATFVTAEDIAAMVVYLASPAAARISGQVLAIDGHSETLLPRA